MMQKDQNTIIVKKSFGSCNIIFNDFVCWKKNCENLIEIQNAFESVSIDKYYIDFNNVVWMDILMLCQLCLYIEKANDYNKEIEFEILDRDNVEHVRFVYFMEEAGFIDFFDRVQPGISEKTNEYLSIYAEGRLLQGNFHSSEMILPLRIIKNEREVSDVINESINLLDERNLGKNTISFRLKLFLQEVLGNVYEHAYDNDENAYCCILICRKIRSLKYKNGIREYNLETGFTGIVYLDRYKTFLNQNNPYMLKKFDDVRVDYIQVYVLDIGKGILSGIHCCDNPKQESSILSQIFTSGKRINRRNKNTQVGGLYMVNNIFGLNADGLGIKGDYYFYPTECERNDFTNIRSNMLYSQGFQQTEIIKGFAIVGYLNIFGDVTKEYRRFFCSPDRKYILEVYKNHCTNILLENASVIDYRYSGNKDFNISDNTKNFIILVGRETAKNILVKFFDDFLCNSNTEEVENVIVADFIDYEISKYYMIFNEMDVRVKKLILISRSYSSAVFTSAISKKTGKYIIKHDSRKTYQYVNNTFKSEVVFDSIYGYINWLIKYESNLFWKFINTFQKNSFQQMYIKSNIKWNYECEKKMKAYLDFSQASFIKECRELFIMQLFRIISIYGTNLYFVSGDRFTEDICELANAELGTKADNERIFIGSAYVTGTSSLKQSVDQKELDDKWFYFFKHADYEGNQDIAALLDWESRDREEYLQEKINYERIGETPFIAPKGIDFFREKLFYNNEAYKIVKMPAKRMYTYLQENNSWSDKVCFFGHVDLVGPHDGIIFNTVEMFKKDRLESYTQPKVLDTSYDFLLFHFYNALGIKQDLELVDAIKYDICSNLISSYATKEKIVEYGKKHKDFFSNRQGILLYFTDYATTKIVGSFQEIFSTELNYRIIPMALVSRERGAATLLLSPLLVDSLQTLINNFKEKNHQSIRVTIFSTMIISTRLIDELKHIMFRIGAEDVTILSLIDRRRLPFGYSLEDKINTFWKLDVPPLGNERNCLICDGISNLKMLSKELVLGELHSRILKICEIWKQKKVFDSNLSIIGGRQIELPGDIKEIVAKQTEVYQYMQGIEITTDVGLVIFSIEDTAITQSLTFLEKCLESTLDDYTKSLLLCAHLGLFKKVEISEKRRYKLTEMLYEYIKKQDSATDNSALASIIIASQDKQIVIKLKRKAKEDIRMQSKYRNLDALICGIFICWFDEEDIDSNIKYYFNSENCKLAERLNEIFLNTCRRCSNTHSGILIRIYDEGGVFQYHDYQKAYYVISYLKRIYFEFPEDILGDMVNGAQLLRKIRNAIASEEKILEKYLSSPNKMLIEEITNSNKEFIGYAEQLNHQLFKVSKDDILQKDLIMIKEDVIKGQRDARNRETLEKVLIEWPNKVDANEYWYFFTSDIISEIKFLLLDFRYLQQKMKWNMPDTYEKQEVTGVVVGKYREKCLEIHFINRIAQEVSINEIKENKEIKYNRPTIVRIKELAKNLAKEEIFEFNFDVVDGEKVLDACLKIPYIYVSRKDK